MYGLLPRNASTASHDEDFDAEFLRMQKQYIEEFPLTAREQSDLNAGRALSFLRRLELLDTVDRRILAVRRRALLKRIAILEVCPIISVYLLGWSIAWIRRGFIGG
jgi:hypothetical protein